MDFVIPDELVKASLAPADGNTSGSTEPSRSEAMGSGAQSHPSYTSHKLRTLAASGLGEAGAMQAQVERMSRTTGEPGEDPRLRPVPRNVQSAQDITRGLGLDPADEQRVQRLATEYGTAGVPQRLGPARTSMQTRSYMLSALRTGMRHVAPDTRDEIMRRAQALWTRENASAAGRPPAISFHTTETQKSEDAPMLFYIPSDVLSKGVARGGRYYRRVPTGKPDRPYRYYYTREEYEKDHGAGAHLHGPEIEERRAVSGQSAEHYAREADKHHDKAGRAADAKTREYHEERAARFEALAEKHSLPAEPSQQQLEFDRPAPAPTPQAPEPVIPMVPVAAGAKAHDIITSWKAPDGVSYEMVPMNDGSGGFTVTFRIRRGTKKAWGEAHEAGKALRDAVRASGDQSFVWSKKLETVYTDYDGPVWGDKHPRAVVSSFRFYPGESRHAQEVLDPSKKTAREAAETSAQAEQDRVRKEKSTRERRARDFASDTTSGSGDADVGALREMQRKLETYPDWGSEPSITSQHRHLSERIAKKEKDAKRIADVNAALASGDPDRIRHEWRRMSETNWSEFNEQKDQLRAAVHALDEAHRADPYAQHRADMERHAKPADIVPVIPMPAEPAVHEPVRPAHEDEKPSMFNRPPPGGWSDKDKVPQPSEEEKAATRARMDAAKAAMQTRQARHRKLVFEVGKNIVINGREYKVEKVAANLEKFGRMITVSSLKEPPKHSRNPFAGIKQLLIRPNGNAEIWGAGATKRDDVLTITGPGVHEGETDVPIAERERVEQPPAAQPVPVAPPESSRGEAAKDTKAAEESGEYVNDRASKIEQRGEDVLGSARHKAAVWKSLREALDSKDAPEMFTREFLSRQEPANLLSRVQRNESHKHALAGVIGYLALNKFPAKPEIPRLFAKDSVNVSYYRGDEFVTGYKYSMGAGIDPNAPTPSVEEHEKRQRASYYAAWQAAKSKVELWVENGGVFKDSTMANTQGLAEGIKQEYEKHRKQYGRNDAGTQALATIHDSLLKRSTTSAAGQVSDFAKRIVQRYGSLEAGTPNIKEHALRLLEGKSMNAAFGTKAERGAKIDLEKLYNTNVMERSGPASEFHGVKQALDELDKSAGGKYAMRGVQWGKSVTDEEREHHLKSIVDSCADLTDILGLPASMASFNGKLAMAVGARGIAGAAAHYEPTQVAINLTRANGAGSLAHEWGHFFDNTIAKITGHMTKSPKAAGAYASAIYNNTTVAAPVLHEMNQLMESRPMVAFQQRLHQDIRALAKAGMLHKSGDYWASAHEVFARCFERHVQRKLERDGRKNTYLAGFIGGAPGAELWPTDEETDALSPHFDALFSAFRESDLLHKALRMMGVPLVDEKYRGIVDRIVIPVSA